MSLVTWLPHMVAVVVVLTLVVPLACFLLRGGYLSTVGAVAVSTAASITVVVLLHAGLQAVRRSGQDVDRVRDRKDGVERGISF